MSGTEALKTLDALLERLQGLHGHLATEVKDVQGQAKRITGVAGMRDDYAAALLLRLVPHLRAIERFAGACCTQVDRIQADPFGEKAA